MSDSFPAILYKHDKGISNIQGYERSLLQPMTISGQNMTSNSKPFSKQLLPIYLSNMSKTQIVHKTAGHSDLALTDYPSFLSNHILHS